MDSGESGPPEDVAREKFPGMRNGPLMLGQGCLMSKPDLSRGHFVL